MERKIIKIPPSAALNDIAKQVLVKQVDSQPIRIRSFYKIELESVPNNG